jgi:hypothetical protein
VLRAVVASVALCAWPARAWAFDAVVRAETQAQAYQVRGPAGAPVLSLRRITQTLSLHAVDRPSSARGVTYTARVRLRIDSDFGSACDPTTDRCLDELNQSRVAEFAPLFARRSLDLPFAYVDATGVWRGRIDLRFGRQLVIDALGFLLFDGGRARLNLGSVLALEVYGGAETRSGFPLSSGRYERDGITRLDRTGWDASLVPTVQDRAAAGVIGVAVETLGDGPLHTRATWRRVVSGDGIAEEKAGLSADLTLSERVRFFGDAVYSIPQRLLATLSVGGEWIGVRGHSVGIELARYRPTFDLTSIWASFWVDPTDDARVRGEVPLGRGWRVSGAVFGRRYALSELAPSPNSAVLPDLYAVGASLGLSSPRVKNQGTFRVQGEGGALGARAGADVMLRVWLRPRIRWDVGLSAWWVTDALRPERDVVSFGFVTGALVRLGRIADIGVNLEDDVNRLVGHRMRAMAVLDLQVPF